MGVWFRKASDVLQRVLWACREKLACCLDEQFSDRLLTTTRSEDTLLAAECKDSSRIEVKTTQVLDDPESDSRKSRKRLPTARSHSEHSEKE